MENCFPAAGLAVPARLTRRAYTPLLALALAGPLLLARPAAAQPTLTGTSPAPQARAAAPSGPVTASFDQDLTPGSTAALRVFSTQQGGLRTGHSGATSLSGSTLSFAPTTGFRPGETVQAIVTTAAASSGGALARPRVWQFTTATGGPGVGNFQPGANPATGTGTTSVATGDVDGDGDLDLVVGNQNGVSVCLNDGAGGFAAGSSQFVASSISSVTLGDIDNDGDLDLLTTTSNGQFISQRLNDGTGVFVQPFGNNYDFYLGQGSRGIVLADVNGDGNLDLVVANTNDNNVSICQGYGYLYNSPGQSFSTGSATPRGVSVGDVDGDGDLDIVVAYSNTSFLGVCLNGGNATGSNTGTFGISSTVAVGSSPYSTALADVDGDGDLDLLSANYASATASVRLNNGSGTFNGTQNVSVGVSPNTIATGDVDGDGDLDLLTTNLNGNTVSVRLNGGDATGSNTGIFSNGSEAAVGSGSQGLALGDFDGDLDLDLATASSSTSTVSVRLNQPVLAAISSFAPGTGEVGTVFDLTGTNLGGVTAVTFAGNGGNVVTTGFTVNAAGTSITGIVVPAGAGSGPLTVTNANGTSLPSTLPFLVTPTISSFAPGSGIPGSSISISGTGLAGTHTITFFGTSANTVTTGFTVVGGTSITGIVVPPGATTGVIRLSTNGSYATSSQTFTVVPSPVISGFSATSGVAGTSVVLSGYYLGAATAVTVNGVAVTPTALTATSLRFVVPAGASATPSITVTTPDGTSPPSTAFTVRLALLSTSPAANAHPAPVAGSALALTFTEPMSAASATPARTSGLKVYSSQVGGRKPGTVSASGNTLSYTSSLTGARTDFRPGETVSVTLPATVLSAGGLAVPRRVYQFTTAVGAAGGGTFAPAPDLTVGTNPRHVATGDVDGDGDLDLLVPHGNSPGTVSVLLNGGNASGSNTGTFSLSQTVSVGIAPQMVALGDVDGDGDLDMVVAQSSTALVAVRLNGGDATGSNTGTFSGTQNVSVSTSSFSVALGDVDGDGDLDMAVATSSTVSVRLNGGNATGSNTGLFSAGANVTTGSNPRSVALADVDGDGDLDLLTVNATNANVAVRLNGGDATGSNTGLFSGTHNVGVGTGPFTVVTGDVDGDGDLDLVTANSTGTAHSVSVRLNGGDATGSNTGLFSGSQDVPVGTLPTSVALGDVDGDGDLDLLASSSTGGIVSVRLNGGDATGSNTGVFSAGADPVVGAGARGVALADVDGDGDLDFLCANATGNSVSVRLNQPPAAAITAIAPGSGAVGSTISLTGTALTGATAITFSGSSGNVVSTGFTVVSATSITGVVVPAGAISGSLTVTTPTGTGPASVPTFTVLPAATLTALSSPAELPGQAVVLTGTNFTSTSTVSFGGVAASVTYNSPTSLTAVVPAGAPVGSSEVRVRAAGVSASLPASAFEVLQVYGAAAASGCLSTAPLVLDGTGGPGAWRYLRLPGDGGPVVAAIENTQNLGTVTAGVNALGTVTAEAVRQDGRAARAYLDRSFYLTATTAGFPGQTVRVRFFGLSSELARLTAVDTKATLAGLQASQYDGANVNCQLADNDPAGERRQLPAPATVPEGADWFVAELAVADHFSEFYLTGAASPLPVELAAFTATAEKRGAAVALAWRTASETSSARFEVERSADGKVFGKIGQVQAQGHKATASAYTFRDATAPAGMAYYRLRQVDLDGTAAYSPIRMVALDDKDGLTLSPNPARSAVAVAGLTAGAAVEVFDALGRPVARAVAGASGTAQLALPAGLAAGVYIVRSGAQAHRLTVE